MGGELFGVFCTADISTGVRRSVHFLLSLPSPIPTSNANTNPAPQLFPHKNLLGSLLHRHLSHPLHPNSPRFPLLHLHRCLSTPHPPLHLPLPQHGTRRDRLSLERESKRYGC